MIPEYEHTVDVLAEKVGILPEFTVECGRMVTPFETKKTILGELGYPVDTPASAAASLKKFEEKDFTRALPPVTVVRKSAKKAEIPVSVYVETGDKAAVSWTVTTETGHKTSGKVRCADMKLVKTRKINTISMQVRLLKLILPNEYGYHTLEVSAETVLPEKGRSMPLIVVPDKCYMPDFITPENRPWGFPAQLYALSSENSWGIGDFSSLKALMRSSGVLGASFVGINPVSTLFHVSPVFTSPYYAISRLFLNALYISVVDVPEFRDDKELQFRLMTPAFKKKLADAQNADKVDYAAVAALKKQAFLMMFDAFEKKHAAKKTARAKAFDRFCAEAGEDLKNLAVYQALADDFYAKGKGVGFSAWGEAYAAPDKPVVVKFAADHERDVRYYMYLQWLAAEQFADVAKTREEAGLALGLYQDLAVGVALESAETWAHADIFLKRLSVGSPPDMFNIHGQKWGVAAMNPEKMRETAYAFYRRILQTNMKTAGALRIDHVMGLARLYLIPDNSQGAYLAYPFEDLIGIIALESVRHKCMVIGEDLGVVPSFFREKITEAGMLSFRIFRYQRAMNGAFLKPHEYPETALTAAGTHDMPTLPGFWTGEDISTGSRLGLIADENAIRHDRENERRAMVEAFSRVGRWFIAPDAFDDEISGRKIPVKLTETVYRYLASTPSKLFLAQLEDILDQTAQMNFPGTVDEYPNWRIKLAVKAEDLADHPKMKAVCAIIRAERNKSAI